MYNHLRERNLKIELYDAVYNEECVVFNIYNFNYQWVGYQIYNPSYSGKHRRDKSKNRYWTYLPKITLGVWGLECFDKRKNEIYIVEGIFKASTLHNINKNAIAVLTSTPKQFKNQFYLLIKNGYNLIAIGDNDKAGNKLINIVGKGFISPLDLDEMNSIDVIELLKEKADAP